jgi:hypothetical protein
MASYSTLCVAKWDRHEPKLSQPCAAALHGSAHCFIGDDSAFKVDKHTSYTPSLGRSLMSGRYNHGSDATSAPNRGQQLRAATYAMPRPATATAIVCW